METMLVVMGPPKQEGDESLLFVPETLNGRKKDMPLLRDGLQSKNRGENNAED